ncbi:ATP-binding protein [Myxococcota bacterium]|nr:ATP-binding protein [Myxococcota bacterium]
MGNAPSLESVQTSLEAAPERAQGIEHRQRLETLGLLSSSLMHDVGNLLGGIVFNLDVLRAVNAPEPELRDSLGFLRDAASRALAMMDQVLTLARPDDGERTPQHLGEAVSELERMITTAAAGRALVRYDLVQHLPLIRAEPTQLRQVVLNLALNAIEATPDRMSVVTISTGTTSPSRERLDRMIGGNDAAIGDYVFVEVADQGAGIEPAHQRRMFEAFFTTKTSGNGLGMFIVDRIVRGHGGVLELDSAPGRGTRIRALFPAITPNT